MTMPMPAPGVKYHRPMGSIGSGYSRLAAKPADSQGVLVFGFEDGYLSCMRLRLRSFVTALMLTLLLVLAGQSPAPACAMGDAACDDHCVITQASCALGCTARLAPSPCAFPLRLGTAQLIQFTSNTVVLDGLVVPPDITPPRPAA